MDIEQSNEPRMSGHSDEGVLVRVVRRWRWSDEEKLAILKETTQPGVIVAVEAHRPRDRDWPTLHLAAATAER